MKTTMKLLLPILALTAAGCSVKAPEVRVTGERTALEQEVLGTYEDLEEDVWMVASTRSSRNKNKARISPEKKRVLEAYRTLKFNKDDVDEFKRHGYVGENRRGFLELRPSPALENSEKRQLVDDVVKEQNEAREVILARMIDVNPKLQGAPRADVEAEFAQINQDSSVKGTWIQQQNGTWVKKKRDPSVS